MKSIAVIAAFLFLTGFNERVLNRDSTCVSPEERKLYNIIMDYRREHRLPSIPLSESLTFVAQTHAHDLSDNYDFDFKNRCNPHSWSSKGGWSPCCYTNDHKVASCMWVKPKELTGYAGHAGGQGHLQIRIAGRGWPPENGRTHTPEPFGLSLSKPCSS